MSERYDKIKADVAFRKEVAYACGGRDSSFQVKWARNQIKPD
jgi:hypothetical protein